MEAERRLWARSPPAEVSQNTRPRKRTGAAARRVAEVPVGALGNDASSASHDNEALVVAGSLAGGALSGHLFPDEAVATPRTLPAVSRTASRWAASLPYVPGYMRRRRWLPVSVDRLRGSGVGRARRRDGSISVLRSRRCFGG
jgi:hypothetical protein